MVVITTTIILRRRSRRKKGKGRKMKRKTEVRNIIIDNFCTALFSGVHQLTGIYNILQHLLR